MLVEEVQFSYTKLGLPSTFATNRSWTNAVISRRTLFKVGFVMNASSRSVRKRIGIDGINTAVPDILGVNFLKIIKRFKRGCEWLPANRCNVTASKDFQYFQWLSWSDSIAKRFDHCITCGHTTDFDGFQVLCISNSIEKAHPQSWWVSELGTS